MHEYRTAKMRKCQCTKLVCTISGCPAVARKGSVKIYAQNCLQAPAE